MGDTDGVDFTIGDALIVMWARQVAEGALLPRGRGELAFYSPMPAEEAVHNQEDV